MKLGKASELLKVSIKMISASRKVGIDVIVNLCERAFERRLEDLCASTNLQRKRICDKLQSIYM